MHSPPIIIIFISFISQFFCQKLSPGGHLASITSTYIHKELVKMMLTRNGAYSRTWIGGLRFLEVCVCGVRKLLGHTVHVFKINNYSSWLDSLTVNNCNKGNK